MTSYTEHGLYIIKDEYFDRFPNQYWVLNKSESRPFYYAIRDKHGLLWMIPLTTKTDRIREKIKRDESRRGKGNCIYYDVGQIAGTERGFKIGDMFPITEMYILRPYTINAVAYVVEDSSLIERIQKKARRYLSLVESGAIRSSVNILEIRAMLLMD